MKDWDALLAAADDDIGGLEKAYEAALREKSLPPALLVKVKNILENQRSALDFLAHDITKRVGKPGPTTNVYFPLAPSAAKFESSIDRKMPGVRAARPDIADVIGQFQPHNREWLAALRDLVNAIKHVRLTPQTRTETREVSITDRHGGRSALIGNVSLGSVGPNGEPGISFGPGGGISFGEGGVIGFGPSGVTVQGTPIDPLTQRPAPGAPVRVQETVWVDWLFEGTNEPVLQTLRAIQAGLREAVDAISAAA